MAYPTPYSYRQYSGDGGTVEYQVPFPYISRVHVHVHVDGTELSVGSGYEWVSGSVIRLKTPPAGGATPQLCTVRRITPEDDQIVQWRDGSYAIQSDLNTADLQFLYLIQEHHDWMVRAAVGLPGLPGAGMPYPGAGFWNSLSRHLDPLKGTSEERAQTVTLLDQLAGLWPADGKDRFIATTDAIDARLKPYVQSSKPPALTGEQDGRFWIDKSEILLRYWDHDALAWIDLANTGPTGPGGPGVYFGDTAPTDPHVDAWYSTRKGRLYLKYQDVDSTQWVDASPGHDGEAGPPGVQGPQGPPGAPGVSAIAYKGALGGTGSPSIATAPASPVVGDTWIFAASGTLGGGWGNIAGTTVAAADSVIRNQSGWDLFKQASVGNGGSGVIGINGTAPVRVGGSAATPTISVDIAVASVAGSGGSSGLMTSAQAERLATGLLPANFATLMDLP